MTCQVVAQGMTRELSEHFWRLRVVPQRSWQAMQGYRHPLR
jgi:hypothetical protein